MKPSDLARRLQAVVRILDEGGVELRPGLPQGGRVGKDECCPTCGEDCEDELIWQDDETVVCVTCGTKYVPA